MAKRKLFWHIGPTDAATAFLPDALEASDATDFYAPAAVRACHADLDLRRAHRAAGLSRKDVEGDWARLESAIWHAKGTWLLSTPAASLISRDQFQLAMDGLRGVAVHFVLFRTPENTDEVDHALATWKQPLHPDRVHIVQCRQSPEAIWETFLSIAGVDPAPLPDVAARLPAGTPAADLLRRTAADLDPGRADALRAAAALVGASSKETEDDALELASRALAHAAEDLAARDHVIARLPADNERLDRKRRKHKRRLAELRDSLRGERPAPASHLGPVA